MLIVLLYCKTYYYYLPIIIDITDASVIVICICRQIASKTIMPCLHTTFTLHKIERILLKYFVRYKIINGTKINLFVYEYLLAILLNVFNQYREFLLLPQTYFGINLISHILYFLHFTRTGRFN